LPVNSARSTIDYDVVGVIAVGAIVGSLGRYGLALALVRTSPTGFPWATTATNILGCLLIGALMYLATEAWPPNRYARPFLGTGVLGGFTTFSTFMADTRGLFAAGAAGVAFAYVAVSVIGGLTAVRLGASGAGFGVSAWRRWSRPDGGADPDPDDWAAGPVAPIDSLRRR
jgi:fluoride exporter